MLEERRIESDWVVATINAPDWVRAQPDKTYSFKAIASCGGKTLKVVHRTAGRDIFVITAHFDRNAKP
jgi:hypothetical protein